MQNIRLNDLNKIKYDESSDYNAYKINTINENNTLSRVKQIKELIRSETECINQLNQ